MPLPPPDFVSAAFGVTGDPVILGGGRGITYRVGGTVLKPVGNEEEATWVAEIFSSIASDDFRVPEPLRSVDGYYVVDGWTAWEFLEGKTVEGEKFDERLRVCRSFQKFLSNLQYPAFLSARSDPWSIADRVVWEGVPWQACPEVGEVSGRLQVLLEPLVLPSQVIHGDMTGNVLFPSRQPPVVIDFVPYWRPRDYATAIFVADSILWESAPASLAKEAGLDRVFWQLLVRAALWRLLVLDVQYQRGHVAGRELSQVSKYQWFTTWLEAVQRQFGT